MSLAPPLAALRAVKDTLCLHQDLPAALHAPLVPMHLHLGWGRVRCVLKAPIATQLDRLCVYLAQLVLTRIESVHKTPLCVSCVERGRTALSRDPLSARCVQQEHTQCP